MRQTLALGVEGLNDYLNPKHCDPMTGLLELAERIGGEEKQVCPELGKS